MKELIFLLIFLLIIMKKMIIRVDEEEEDDVELVLILDVELVELEMLKTLI